MFSLAFEWWMNVLMESADELRLSSQVSDAGYKKNRNSKFKI